MAGSTILTQHPDLILHSGVVAATGRNSEGVTLKTSEALAVSDGTVLVTGSDEDVVRLAGDTTEIVDLAGRTVLPGFIESHAHLVMFGLSLIEVNCRPDAVGSIRGIQDTLAKTVAKREPGEWIIGWGWDEGRMTDGRGPTRWDIDEVAPENPVFLRRTCGHMAVANSAALATAGVSRHGPDPDGGRLVRDASGELTGLLQERALGLVQPPPYSAADIELGIHLAQDAFLARGITTIHDMATQSEHLRVLDKIRRDQRLRMRIRPWLWALDGNGKTGMLDAAVATGLKSGFGDDWVRIQGVKFMLDGSVGGLTAAVDEPYEGTDERGLLIADTAAAHPGVLKAVSNGLRAAIHGIGDRAVDTAVSVLTKVFNQLPEAAAMRHRVEHCALPSEENLEDMSRYGIIAASSVGFLHELGDRYLNVLGPERMARVYPQRTFAERGIIAPPNSDCPVTDANPWNVISAAVTRTSETGRVLDTQQNVSVSAAIHGYTQDAAYASFEEDTLGALVPGAHADFVILDADPFAVVEFDLHTIAVDRTYVAGRVAFDRSSVPTR